MVINAPSIRPERSRTTRSQRCASEVSCVTSTKRHAALGMLGEQEVDDLLAGGLIEIAGRLVRDENRRIGRQRAGQRDALLLAARELRRIVMQPLAEPDGCQLLRRARSASRSPASSSGTATFSSAVMVGIR